ncbi:MAG: hypothetical protein H6618_03450 [Deltaproteobacteria bacterium]|nr:hypothetical protein [Deltaproteobacteria bacterium]
MIREALEKLLPQGFIWEDKGIRELCRRISRELSAVADFAEKICSEIPGKLSGEIQLTGGESLRGYLRDWMEFCGLSQQNLSPDEANSALTTRLSESGDHSLKHLSHMLQKVSGRRDIRVQNSHRSMEIEVTGLNLTVFPVTCRSSAGRPIRKFEREEHVIRALERIKHAHLESRYFDAKRTVYAQD